MFPRQIQVRVRVEVRANVGLNTAKLNSAYLSASKEDLFNIYSSISHPTTHVDPSPAQYGTVSSYTHSCT